MTEKTLKKLRYDKKLYYDIHSWSNLLVNYKFCGKWRTWHFTKAISWDGKHEIDFKKLKGALSQVHNHVIGTKFHYTICENGSRKSDKLFKKGPSKICERQSFENLKQHGLLMLHFAWSILEYFVSNDDMYDGSFLFISFIFTFPVISFV